MRLVLDTNVVRAAFCSASGASASLLRACALRAGLVPLASVPLALEYEDVCTRPAALAAAGLPQARALAFVDTLLALCEAVRVHFLWRPRLSDPADEFVLEAAANGRAAAIATHNRRHFAAAAPRFGVAVLTPAEVLGRLA